MKLPALLTAIYLSTLTLASNPSNPVISALLARAFDMVDLEGECARQACTSSPPILHPTPSIQHTYHTTGTAMNPSTSEHCTRDMIASYRPQCAGVLCRSGLKSDAELRPEVEEKLREALGQAKGVVTPGMAEGFWSADDKGQGEGMGVEDLMGFMKGGGRDEL